jgi:hypothetical protein
MTAGGLSGVKDVLHGKSFQTMKWYVHGRNGDRARGYPSVFGSIDTVHL